MEKISVEEIEEGLLVPTNEGEDVGIDMETQITKEEFKAQTKELYEKLSGLSKRTDINDAEKKNLATQYTQDIKNLLKPFFALGLKGVTDLRKKETQNMEQLLAIYKLLEKFYNAKDKTVEEITKLEEEIKLLNECESKGTKIKFFKDIDAVLLDRNAEFIKNISIVKRELESKIIAYAMPVFDVEMILNTITPATLKDKSKILTDASLFNYKKTKFAAFCKKKFLDKKFLSQFKKDADYLYTLASLCKEAARKVVTIDDVADSYLEDGETKEEYLEKFLSTGSKELNNLSMISAVFIIDFVISEFSDNDASRVDRHMYLGLLFNRANYDMMREVVVKFVYTMGDMTY